MAKENRVKTVAPADGPDLRFRDTVPLKKFRSKQIGIAGLGAVGRHVAILLGVMGHKKLFGADPDVIELKNVGTQGWDERDVGIPKSQALERFMTRTNEGERTVFRGLNQRFEDAVVWVSPGEMYSAVHSNIVFCCVDKMRARADIWQKVTDRPNLQGLWLDSRMAPRVIRIIAADLGNEEDRKYYQSTLFSDAEGFEGSCTDRMTVYGAYMAAGWMVSQMVNWLRGQLVKKDVVFESLGCSVTDVRVK